MSTYNGTAYDDSTITAATPGASTVGGSLTIAAGDVFNGGAGGVSTDLASGVAAPGYYAEAMSSLTVNGSSFNGGDDYSNGAPGAIFTIDASGSLSITAGTFTGGASTQTGDGGAGCAIGMAAGATGTISGGTFNPGQDAATITNGFGLGLAVGAGGSVTISGGDLVASSFSPRLALNLAATATVTFTGSSLSLTGTAFGGTLTGGQSLSGLALVDLGGNIAASGGGSTLTLTGT